MIGSSFNFFTRVANSIVNFDFYKHVVKERTGKAVSYLLLLTFFLGLLISIRPAVEFNEGVSLFINAYEEKVPDFVLKNGELNVQGDMPVTIESLGSVIIIDTSGHVDEEVLDKYVSGIFISKHKVVQKNLFDKREIDFRQMEDIVLTKSMVRGWLPFLRLGIIFIFMIMPIAFIISRFFTALIVSLIGLAINTVLRTNLTFSDLFKLSAYILTLPIIIVSILKAGAIYVPAFWLIYLAISAAYMWKALDTIGRDSTPIDPSVM